MEVSPDKCWTEGFFANDEHAFWVNTSSCYEAFDEPEGEAIWAEAERVKAYLDGRYFKVAKAIHARKARVAAVKKMEATTAAIAAKEERNKPPAEPVKTSPPAPQRIADRRFAYVAAAMVAINLVILIAIFLQVSAR